MIYDRDTCSINLQAMPVKQERYFFQRSFNPEKEMLSNYRRYNIYCPHCGIGGEYEIERVNMAELFDTYHLRNADGKEINEKDIEEMISNASCPQCGHQLTITPVTA